MKTKALLIILLFTLGTLLCNCKEDCGCKSDIEYYENDDTAFLYKKKYLLGISNGHSSGYYELCNPEILPKEIDSLNKLNSDSVIIIFSGGIRNRCNTSINVGPFPLTITDIKILNSQIINQNFKK